MCLQVDWLEWVEKKGLLGPFVGLGAVADPSSIVADWFAQRFVVDHSKAAISIVQRKKGILHPHLWNRITQRLSGGKNPPGPQTLKDWLPALLVHDHPQYSDELLEYMLTGCKGREYALAALVLFRRLAKPIMVSKTNFRILIRIYEVTIRGSEYWLMNAWHDIFKPELANFTASLMPIITAQFQEAQEMLRLAGQVQGDSDRLSSWRKAIEVHEAGPIPNTPCRRTNRRSKRSY